MSPGRPQVLFICADPVGPEMAGLGIRYTELAGVLAGVADVTVAHGGRGSTRLLSGAVTVPYRPHAPDALRPLIRDADVVVTHPQWPTVSAWLRRSRARVVFDLYDPETLETLVLFSDRRPAVRGLTTALSLDRLRDALAIGDHFMCASEKQRDLWLGSMLALGLIGPDEHARDPSFRSVIDLVPFGVPEEPPEAGPTAQGPRERFAQLDDRSELVLWNGGVWGWLDPETAIRATAELHSRRPGVRLVFMGGSPEEAARAATERARSVARELGVLDSVVLFNERWVPYHDRAAWLRQADCALSTHPDHLETRFAFRTRLLDCFWAGLPVVCTSGDDLASRVERDELGVTAPPGDAAAVAAALERVLDRGREHYAPALATAARAQTWPQVAAPLTAWVSLADRKKGARGRTWRTPSSLLRGAAYRVLVSHVLDRRGG